MISRRVCVLLLVMVSAISAATGIAIGGTFYLHDHDAYWWYVSENPAYSIVVPNNAERYSEKTVVGQQVMEMTWDEGSVMIQVASLTSPNPATVIDSVKGQFLPFLTDVEVLDDREITTGNGVSALFYAAVGEDPAGTRAMIRTVVFERDGQMVYLLMTLDSARFQADSREYWLRAVNGFQWD